MWLNLAEKRAPKLKDPAMLVSVSTSMPQYSALYSQGRELADYLLRKVKLEELATFNSSSLPSEVIVREDGRSTLPACHVHLAHGRRDVLLFSGDSSPMDEQYQFTRHLLTYAKGLGVKELYSVGARWTENPVSPDSDPELKGFSTDKQGTAKLEKCGVKLVSEEAAPFFASMVVGLAKEFGIRGYKLSVDHGEPSPHPRSVAKIIGVLSTLTGLEVSLDELRPGAAPPPTIPKQVGDTTIYH